MAKEETKALSLNTLIKMPSTIEKFKNALGGGTATEKENRANAFLATVMSVANNNAMLKKVNPLSILTSAMQAATLDLQVIPALGFSAIYPYGNQAQFQIMVKGYTQLALRTGQIKALNVGEIYADEYNGFNKIKGELNPLNEHKEDCTEIVGYFCYMALVNGFEKTEYWSKDKVCAHGKRYSKTFNNGPWKDNFDAMAKKTVLKAMLTKYAPQSTQMQMQSAFSADQAIIHENEDGSFSYDYQDNPNNEENIEVQNDINTNDISDKYTPIGKYTPEEMKHREEILTELAKMGIDANAIVQSEKGSKSIDDVTISRLEEILNTEKGV